MKFEAGCLTLVGDSASLSCGGLLVSPEGIDLVQSSAKRESVEKESTPLGQGRRPMGRVADDFRANQLEAEGRELVSPEGIEPSTNRLRVCCSAS